jgi:HlyD family secretion protein
MKRVLVILLVLTTLAAVGFGGYQYLTVANAQGPVLGPLQGPPQGTNVMPSNVSPNSEIVQIGRQTLVKTVSATGSIEPKAKVDMKFQTGGTVKEVLVQEGQVITAGTVLARLDTSTLELEVRSAEIDLAQAQANLDKLYEPASTEKVAAAKAKIESARLSLEDQMAGPDADDVTKAEATLKQKEIALQKAQWAYDQVSYRGDVGAMSQANDLQSATLDYESALADYNLAVKKATPAELASARSSLADAQSSLADLLTPPSAADVASQQANVDKAQLTLEEKQLALEEAVLVAPTGGVVLVVNIEPGERVLEDASEAALTIADTSTYLLKMEVDELDIGQVQPGQRAAVTLDAFAKQTFEGTVTNVAPSPVSSEAGSIVTYEVTIILDTQGRDLGFLTGMTANANIETQRIEDAVVVPNRAIQTEQVGGEAVTYVEKLDAQGNPMRVEIELGLRSGSVTAVLAGLAEGDRVVIRQQSATTPAGF